MARDSEVEYLRQKALEAEKELGGEQLRWASTPKQVPAIRRRGVLFSGVLGARRQYAFAKALDQELFVYDRHDTLFTTSRDIRQALDLSPPVFKGTFVAGATGPAPATTVTAAPKARRKAPAPAPSPQPAPAPAPVLETVAAAPSKGPNRFRK